MNILYQPAAPSDSSEFRRPVSEVDLEGYAMIQPISSLVLYGIGCGNLLVTIWFEFR
jgi:hypothetical protein